MKKLLKRILGPHETTPSSSRPEDGAVARSAVKKTGPNVTRALFRAQQKLALSDDDHPGVKAARERADRLNREAGIHKKVS
ncbi:MAG: hypothetical protein A2408_00900 [Candidatus Yonathbacteria bacterium RIFOXYC1_FULL_52_10]|uniref:Uncharacterized protein n=1 Tax=Candidatus Yonathbacteria bacterium RIFOXYD1_FULL_52_36 TaxID=1802730 RepID=A0A1G2SLK4_9BACT|nr:MAG: hypothetical protein A2591_03835 [Candidatus Yonathbacteria bacterium RIFOXYD1_FULL_52_36]OHA85702.1 MAG: hypothetical protein A2408_00900 [Candidatus Yonathbacteria bacterium RIFOXYC1_FULL_52_10]